MGMTELLTVAETAALLKTTKQQVRKMISQQLIPAMKIGREWRVSGQYLEDFCKRTIITRPEQSYGRVPFTGLCRNLVHFRICSRCRTAGCQGISFSISSWVGDLPR